MTKKAKLFTALFVPFSLSMLVVPFLSRTKSPFLNILGGYSENNFSVNLNSSNSPVTQSHTTYGDVIYAINEYSSLTLNNVKYSENSVCEIGDSGSIYKSGMDSSYNLKNIKATFKGILKIYSSYEAPVNDEFDIEGELVSGREFLPTGNYFKIVSEGVTILNSLDISYGCFEAEKSYAPAMEDISLLHENNYANLEYQNGKNYFVFEGKYSTSAPSKNQIKLVGDVASDILTCERVEYRNNKGFAAYFPIDSYFSTQTTTYKPFYPHIYFNNQLWSGYQYGDMVNTDGTNLYKPANTYLANSMGGAYYLSYVNDIYPMAYIRSYKSFKFDVKSGDSYADIINLNNHTYLTLEGDISIASDYEIDVRSLVLRDKNHGDITASKVEHGDSSSKIYFDLNGLYSKMQFNEGRGNLVLNPRLLINGNSYDNSDGYIDNGTKPHSDEEVIKNRYCRINSSNSKLEFFLSEIRTIEFKDFLDGGSANDYRINYNTSIKMINNKPTLSLKGHFKGTFGNYKFDKTAITLFSENESLDCDNLVIENPLSTVGKDNRFIAYFDLTNIKFDTFYAHIKFNGENFDGDKGDLRPGCQTDLADGTLRYSFEYNNKNYNLYSMWNMVLIKVE